jgi:hypothetical protein
MLTMMMVFWLGHGDLGMRGRFGAKKELDWVGDWEMLNCEISSVLYSCGLQLGS